MRAPDAVGLLAQGILAATVLVAVAGRALGGGLRAGSQGTCAAWIALVALACAVPLGEVTAAAHLRGLVGDPSITSVLLLVLAVLRPSMLPDAPSARAAALLAGAAAALLYLPLVTGSPAFGIDLHGMGWQPAILLAWFGGWSAFAWYCGAGRWVAVLSVALLAWGLGAVESDNLLDAMVDPGLVAAGAVVAVRGLRLSRRAVPR